MNLIQIDILKEKLEKDFTKQKSIAKIGEYVEVLCGLALLKKYEQQEQKTEIGLPLLVKTQSEYIDLITEENIEMAKIAMQHGYITKEEWAKNGIELRATIDKLKKAMV